MTQTNFSLSKIFAALLTRTNILFVDLINLICFREFRNISSSAPISLRSLHGMFAGVAVSDGSSLRYEMSLTASWNLQSKGYSLVLNASVNAIIFLQKGN